MPFLNVLQKIMQIRLPYRRPKSLSDPFHDFTKESLGAIIETPDEEMTWQHYQQILGPFLPAGTYEESAYFLPLAFSYILGHDDEALDLVTSLAWFISEYRPKLEADGAGDSCRMVMQHCLDHWIKDFKVIHFDKEGCEKKQWRLYYFDYVKNAETVAECTCDLVRFVGNADLAIDFYQRLSRDCASAIEAAWFLEFARQHVTGDVRSPPNHGEITKVLQDKGIAERSAEIVASELPEFSVFPSYWRDLFTALHIESVPTPEWAEPGSGLNEMG